MRRPTKTTMAKRNRERELQLKRQDKEERRVQRKAQKDTDLCPSLPGEDPALIGLKSGPQPPYF